MEMDGKEEVSIFDLANELSDVCKKSPKISFRISYTATNGNKDIHKAFLSYAHDKANNEYLAAIGKLLEVADTFYYLKALESQLAELNVRVAALEAKPVEVKDESKKTL